MADQKASVVLGAAFVMATIVFGDLTGLDEQNVETVMLACTAVLSGVLAALAVMPRIMVGGEVSEVVPNLLFFGAIAQMNREMSTWRSMQRGPQGRRLDLRGDLGGHSPRRTGAAHGGSIGCSSSATWP